ncbi:MAG: hypothetical protein M3114_02675 [Thermoproteota archaeon]|nr:hypothetical protein [Thermoproteota archaeon]
MSAEEQPQPQQQQRYRVMFEGCYHTRNDLTMEDLLSLPGVTLCTTDCIYAGRVLGKKGENVIKVPITEWRELQLYHHLQDLRR